MLTVECIVAASVAPINIITQVLCRCQDLKISWAHYSSALKGEIIQRYLLAGLLIYMKMSIVRIIP